MSAGPAIDSSLNAQGLKKSVQCSLSPAVLVVMLVMMQYCMGTIPWEGGGSGYRPIIFDSEACEAGHL